MNELSLHLFFVLAIYGSMTVISCLFSAPSSPDMISIISPSETQTRHTDFFQYFQAKLRNVTWSCFGFRNQAIGSNKTRVTKKETNKEQAAKHPYFQRTSLEQNHRSNVRDATIFKHRNANTSNDWLPLTISLWNQRRTKGSIVMTCPFFSPPINSQLKPRKCPRQHFRNHPNRPAPRKAPIDIAIVAYKQAPYKLQTFCLPNLSPGCLTRERFLLHA